MESDLAPLELTSPETERLATLGELAQRAVDAAGAGAWAERKPASVAVHIREAEAATAARALEDLRSRVADVDGATSIAGSAVLELFARPASKGDALRSLRDKAGTTSTVFVGDDVTDEHAFAALGHDDVGIKVGDATTVAGHRLRDPDAVVNWLGALCAAFDRSPDGPAGRHRGQNSVV